MKERDILRFEGPRGSFFLREESPKPIILVAGGTGLAPIKSIIEHAIHNKIERPMSLYWGARDRAGVAEQCGHLHAHCGRSCAFDLPLVASMQSTSVA